MYITTFDAMYILIVQKAHAACNWKSIIFVCYRNSWGGGEGGERVEEER